MNNRLLTVCTEDGTGWANCWGWSKEAQDPRVGQGLAEGMLRKGEEVPGQQTDVEDLRLLLHLPGEN